MKVDGASVSGVVLSFSKAEGATRVVLMQSIDGGNNWSPANVNVNKNSLLAMVFGLSPGTTYHFQLIVTGGSRAGESNVVTVSI
ncbi:hypothetical protein [Brevibacillus sp. SIMBA_076]|uniref:hypothetical protein n=1 Tax=Brevibacillus sp. SIMBA_076 TaxID=3085814 RepID=UPI00397A3B17